MNNTPGNTDSLKELDTLTERMDALLDDLDIRTEFWLRRTQALADTNVIRAGIREFVEIVVNS